MIRSARPLDNRFSVSHKMKLVHHLLLFVLVGVICVGCNFPRDPRETLDRVRGGVMRVGVTEHEPWVKRLANDEAAGVEVELVREFAEELDAEIEWIWGTEQAHLEALERYELDLVIGGLTRASPWRRRVGFTNPYFTAPVTVGVPPSQPPLQTIEGVQVAVRPGEVTAAYLRGREATPVPVKELSQVNGPVAAPVWELNKWGYTVTGFDLFQAQHVMAVPPGENGWLVRLEQFLLSRRSRIQEMLQQDTQL